MSYFVLIQSSRSFVKFGLFTLSFFPLRFLCITYVAHNVFCPLRLLYIIFCACFPIYLLFIMSFDHYVFYPSCQFFCRARSFSIRSFVHYHVFCPLCFSFFCLLSICFYVFRSFAHYVICISSQLENECLKVVNTLLSVPKVTSNLYCICPSIYLRYT